MIYLTDSLAVTADHYSYNVGEVRKRAGKDILVNTKYYGTMAQAINGAIGITLRQGISSGTIDTLHAFLQEEQKLYNDFSRKLESLNC